jgi:hypothetical protein
MGSRGLSIRVLFLVCPLHLDEDFAFEFCTSDTSRTRFLFAVYLSRTCFVRVEDLFRLVEELFRTRFLFLITFMLWFLMRYV